MLSSKIANMPNPAGPFPTPDPTQIGDFPIRFGACISSWQLTESIIFHIYARIVGPRNYDSLAVSFHATTNFKLRLDMTNYAIVHSQDSRINKEKWRILFKEAVLSSRKRNKIAHSILLFQHDDSRIEKQLRLGDGLDDPRKNKNMMDGDFLFQNDLESISNNFEDLHFKMQEFLLSLPFLSEPG